jgi:enterochelin esterase-like enzyme
MQRPVVCSIVQMSWVFAVGLIGVVLVATSTTAQSPPDPDYVRQPLFASYDAFKGELQAIVDVSDATERQSQLDGFWDTLKDAGQVPYAQGDRYAFLYRGSQNSVGWRGDFNGWGVSSGTKYAGTDLWIREGTLPDDGRVDYKIFADNNWLLDPANPLQVWSGFGPNSELRMPEYEYPIETIRREGSAPGALSGNIRMHSDSLAYDVQYRVYTPAGYTAEDLADLSVVYVTDGHEYAADHLGSLVAVMDNLIDDGSIRPALAVFIDPRNPDNLGENRRINEYNMNPQFADFVTDELVPAIDAGYRTSDDAASRVILGTSLGGLNSAYFGAARRDTFAKIAIQSPAFSFNPSIYSLYQNADPGDIEIFMTAGTINDGSGGPTMATILANKNYDYTYEEANEGHSWGNWRARLGDMLIALVGPPEPLPGDANGDSVVDGLDYLIWAQNFGDDPANDPPGSPANGDLNDDGRVDGLDYVLWAGSYGAGAAVSVPEPGLAGLLVTGLAIVMLMPVRRTTLSVRSTDS